MVLARCGDLSVLMMRIVFSSCKIFAFAIITRFNLLI